MNAEKLDNSIKLVYEILEKNKNNSSCKDAYEDIVKLAKKREIKL